MYRTSALSNVSGICLFQGIRRLLSAGSAVICSSFFLSSPLESYLSMLVGCRIKGGLVASLAFPRKYNSDFSNCLTFYMKLKRLGFLHFERYFIVYMVPLYWHLKIADVWGNKSTRRNENVGKEVVSFLTVFLSELKIAHFVPTATIAEQWS